MKGFFRLAFAPALFPAYVVYGAFRGYKDETGFAKGAMLGALFATTYIITGDRLEV